MEEEDVERGDMAFLKELLSPGPGANDDFSREWQDAFGLFEPSNTPPAAEEALNSGAAANPPSSSPTGFLPSQLLDHSLSSTGRQACPLPAVASNCSPSTQTPELSPTIFWFVAAPLSRLVHPTNVPGSAPAASSWPEPAGPAGLRINS